MYKMCFPIGSILSDNAVGSHMWGIYIRNQISFFVANTGSGFQQISAKDQFTARNLNCILTELGLV